MIYRFESVQQSYEKQCEDIMNYVEMIDDLRQVVYKNIRELSGTSSSSTTITTEYLQAPSSSHNFDLTRNEPRDSIPLGACSISLT